MGNTKNLEDMAAKWNNLASIPLLPSVGPTEQVPIYRGEQKE